MGTTPGVIAIIGCSNYPAGTKDVYNIAEEFLNRNYLIAVSGCSAMDIGMFKDADGKTLYERDVYKRQVVMRMDKGIKFLEMKISDMEKMIAIKKEAITNIRKVQEMIKQGK